MNNDLKLTTKEKLYFLFLFIMYCVVSTLDYNSIILF